MNKKIKKAIFVLGLLLIGGTNSMGKEQDHTITTPVIIDGYFVGGLEEGKWLECEVFYNKYPDIMDDFEYDAYTWNKRIGLLRGTKPYNLIEARCAGDTYEEGYAFVKLYNKENTEKECDIALKADWNLFPRTYKLQSNKQKVYQDIAKKVLVKEKMNVPTAVKQLIRVDLNGDGIEEVLMSAGNKPDDTFDPTHKGDHSFILFRNLVKGKVQEQVVEGSLVHEEPEVQTLFRISFEVSGIADLDGDGVMEVIIRNWYYEGEGYGVYKLIDNKLVYVAGNGWGV